MGMPLFGSMMAMRSVCSCYHACAWVWKHGVCVLCVLSGHVVMRLPGFGSMMLGSVQVANR